MFGKPCPQAAIELTKYGCKSGCVGSRCKCYSNKLPCTPSANVMLLSLQIWLGRKYESVISKTKIPSESTIRIDHVLFCIHFGQTGHMMFLDCSYKYVVFFLFDSFNIPYNILACLNSLEIWYEIHYNLTNFAYISCTQNSICKAE